MSKIMRDRIEFLEDRVEELEERVLQLENLKFGLDWLPPVELGLTQSEGSILAALVANERCSKEWLLEASRVGGDGYRRDEVEMKVIDVWICKIRKKIAPFGLKIQTLWGRGYQVSPEHQQRLLNWGEDMAA